MANPPNRDQLDTGLGGFVVPPEDAPSGADGIYTYDVGDPDRISSRDYPIRDRSLHGGNVSVDHSPKDLSRTTRVTLGHFLGKRTEINRYPIDTPENTRDIQDIHVTRLPTGATPQVRPSPNRAQHGRGRDIDGTSTSWNAPLDGPQGYSGTVYHPHPSDVGFAPGNTQPPGSGFETGNEVLSRANDSSPVVQIYSRSILGNNRFTPDVKSFEGDPNADPSFPGDKFDDPVGAPPISSPRFGSLDLRTRASVAGYLMDGARGGISKEGSPLVPPRINMDDIDVTKFLSLGVDDLSLNMTNIRGDSRGVLLDPYNTWGSFGNLLKEDTLAVLLPAVVIGVAGVITSIVQFSTKAEGTNLNFRASAKTAETLGDMTYGSSFSTEGDSQVSSYLTSTFGLKRTYFLYTDAVAAGVIMYSLQRFIPTADRIWSGLEEGFMKGLAGTPEIFSIMNDQSMGQIKIVSKKILIQYEQFRKSVASVKVGWDSFPNFLQQYTEIIAGSGLINTLNVFATLGDAVLNQWPTFLTGAYKDLEGAVDGTTDSSEYSALGGRRGGYGWSSKNSAHILLGQIDKKRSETKLITFDSKKQDKLREIEGKTKDLSYTENTGQVKPELAFQFEQALEAEYVPFYFLDTRTNEIISFHAFLDSLNETYSPQIDSIDALGRAEPIKIYKGVQRKVSLSFYVVALNIDDFEFMWTKMNKLLTLVYPQYSPGRMLEATNAAGETFNFRQPFSQIMSASPLIRLRVGNLIRSNYTERAMQDQFGAFDADTFLPKTPETPTPAVVTKKTETKQLGKGKHILFTKASYVVRKSEIETIGSVVDEIIALINSGKKITTLTLVGYASTEGDSKYNQKLSLYRVNETSWVFAKVWVDKASKQNWYSTSPEVALSEVSKGIAEKRKITNYRLPFVIKLDSEGETSKFGGNSLEENRRVTFFAEYEETTQTESNGDDGRGGGGGEGDGGRTVITNIKYHLDLNKANYIKKGTLFDFLSPSNNSVIKSFQDSGAGGGLAGFIESLSLDWVNNQTTWDITPGKKAPKMCKITMDFSPIHDIAPGLNHRGFNRAPIYNFSAVGGRDPDLSGFKNDSIGNKNRIDAIIAARPTSPEPPLPPAPPAASSTSTPTPAAAAPEAATAAQPSETSATAEAVKEPAEGQQAKKPATSPQKGRGGGGSAKKTASTQKTVTPSQPQQQTPARAPVASTPRATVEAPDTRTPADLDRAAAQRPPTPDEVREKQQRVMGKAIIDPNKAAGLRNGMRSSTGWRWPW